MKNNWTFRQFGEDLLKGKGSYTAPNNYNHDTQVDEFRKRVSALNSTEYFCGDLTSENFARATNKLTPGATYAIKMFPVVSVVDSKHCLAFLKENNAILVGAQGLTALQEDQPHIFPLGNDVVSFDEESALGSGAIIHKQIPYIRQEIKDLWVFSVCNFNFQLYTGGGTSGSGNVLVCFSDNYQKHN